VTNAETKILALEKQVEINQQTQRHDSIQDLEARLQTMTVHVLQRTNDMEVLSSERAALRVQLEEEKQKVLSLQRTVSILEAKQDMEIDYFSSNSHFDIEKGPEKSSLRDRNLPPSSKFNRNNASSAVHDSNKLSVPYIKIQNETVAKAVAFVDDMGKQLGVSLHKYHMVRIAFGSYLVILHLWVLFVMFHFVHHESVHTTDHSGAVDNTATLSIP
jgi:predicted RNase H-like nuclease (RuvC/YqgF family)